MIIYLPLAIVVHMNQLHTIGEALKVLEEQIEILKLNLLFLMAERKPENMMSQNIITIKRELDKAIQKRMNLSQIYCRHNSSSVAVVDMV